MVLLTYTIQNQKKLSERITGVVVSKQTLEDVIKELDELGKKEFERYELIVIPVNAGFITVANDLLSEEREKQNAKDYFSGALPGTNRFVGAHA